MSKAISIFDYSKKTVLIRIVDKAQRKKWEKILIDLGANSVGTDGDPGWLLSKSKIDELDDIINECGSRAKRSHRKYNSSKEKADEECVKSEESRNEESSDSSDDSDDTDDEMIKVALARKIMSESSGKSIENDYVNDSNEEDVVSMCRRFRHVYSLLNKMNVRIKTLEQIVYDKNSDDI